MELVREGNVECNYNESGPPIDGLLPGWCRQGPVNDVYIWYNKSVFNFDNRSPKPKLAIVRRTLNPNGPINEYTFRVDAADSTTFHSILWLAPQDEGYLELVSVVESPLEGSLEALGQMDQVDDDHPYPRIINNSPYWVYVGALIGFDGHPAQETIQNLLAPNGGRIQTVPLSKRATIDWRAAEPQRDNLYMPFPS